MKMIIYTTIFGNYDTYKPVPVQNLPEGVTEVIPVLIGDVPSCQKLPDIEEGYLVPRLICEPGFPRMDLHPRLRAKYHKILPGNALEQCNVYSQEKTGHNIFVYIDATVQVTSPDFAIWAKEALGTSDLALFGHPERTEVVDEIKESRKLKKYDSEPLNMQYEHYSQSLRLTGTEPRQLCACGVLIRRHLYFSFYNKWWAENVKWSYQDQISFWYIFSFFRGSGDPQINVLSGQLTNPHFKIIWNLKKSDL